MSSVLQTCPFCNARMNVDRPPPGQRLICVRCGESFPFRASEDGSALTELIATSQNHVGSESRRSARSARWSNGLIASVILGGMCLMALIALQFALSTVQDRREVDRQRPVVETLSVPLLARFALGVYVVGIVVSLVRSWNRRAEPESAEHQTGQRKWVTPLAAAAFVIGIGLTLLSIESRPSRQPRPSNEAALAPLPNIAPIELPALGYLPPDTNVVAGFHVRQALQKPLGRALILDSSLKLGDVSFESLEKWTGLKFPQIDHAVLGIKLDDQLPPRTMLVVRTISPIDEEEVRRAIGKTSMQRRHGRNVFGFTLDRPRLDAFGWLPDDRTLIVTLNAKDMDFIPATPSSGGDRLLPELQSYLRERAGSADVWAVGHVPDWNKTPLHLLSTTELKNDWAVISKLRTFAAWFGVGEDVAFHADFECTDDGAAAALIAFLSQDARSARKGMSQFLPAFDGSPIVEAFKRSAETTQDGTCVRIQAKADADAIRKRP